MNYYLITEGDQYTICIVKPVDNEIFVQRCADQILSRSCNIMELLCLVSKNMRSAYSFSEN
jgi:hypothetical protein